MILQALNDYYDRLLADPDGGVPDFGFGNQGVHYCLTLDREGNMIGAPLPLCDEDGKPKRLEVTGPVIRSSGVLSNFAWDNTGYVLGVDEKGKPERSEQTHEAFKALAAQVLDGVEDEGAAALKAFLDRWNPADAASLPACDEMVGKNVVFRLDGENRFLHDRPAFRRAWTAYLESAGSEHSSMCLVTGEPDAAIPATHASIKGVPGAQTSGAALVSFNFKAAKSYGKDQNLNAPVSERAAFGYTTALNHLLAPGSERKVQIGDTTVVFWTDAPAADSESMFSFAVSGRRAEDETLALRLETQLSSIARGRFPDELGDPQTRFYVLGLSPNAARLSVRFWHVATVGEIVRNIGLHYSHLALKRNFDNEREHPGPWWILKELAPQRDSRNISSILTGQVVKAIIQNTPYPRTMLTAAVGRIRADKHVNYLRASVIKAYLVRNTQQELQMTLDTGNTDIGYRLGRLFAMVERIQEESVPGANATVRDRFFGSASATPARTFPIILRNAQHGLAKIRKDRKGLAVHLEKGIQEIVSGMDAKKGFPASMNLESQGMFILGYYQQRQDQFTKKEDKTEE